MRIKEKRKDFKRHRVQIKNDAASTASVVLPPGGAAWQPVAPPPTPTESKSSAYSRVWLNVRSFSPCPGNSAPHPLSDECFMSLASAGWGDKKGAGVVRFQCTLGRLIPGRG